MMQDDDDKINETLQWSIDTISAAITEGSLSDEQMVQVGNILLSIVPEEHPLRAQIQAVKDVFLPKVG